jgi:beta-phosphoglucomutase
VSQRGAIFDLDGTLIDSYAAHFKAWTSVAAEIGHMLTEPQFQSQFGRKNEPILMELHELAGKPCPTSSQIELLAEIKETRYLAMIAEDFPEMPGCVALILALRDARWKVAIGSSAPRSNIDFCIKKFKRLGIEFDAVACGDDVSRGKPAPDVFLLAASQLGVSPEACVVLEDAVAGIDAAKNAAMGSVGVCSTGRTRAELVHADIVIDCFSELTPDILAGLRGAVA